ncbi:uncharacterized protein [Watersipora subatra]|uniref:uncharacterized protein n=1 Tax=Watersipora subatra TaxID=2589382 RepID=UPI00355AF229
MSEFLKVVQEDVMTCLRRVDIEDACDILHNYLSDPSDLTKKDARDQLLYTDEVKQFFHDNAGMWDKKFVECVKRLASYTATLLKPKHMRPEGFWETIMLSNHIYEEYVSPYPSHNLVLEAIGYRQIGESYIFRNGNYSIDKTIKVCSDLLVLRAFVEVTLGIKRERPAVLPVRSELKKEGPIKTIDTESTCEICSKPARFLCSSSECEGKAWCDKCNDKWHVKNPKRGNHPYKEIPNYKQQSPPIAPKPIAPKPIAPKPIAPKLISKPTNQTPPPVAPARSTIKDKDKKSAVPKAAARPVPAPRQNKLSTSNAKDPASPAVQQRTQLPVYMKEINKLQELVDSMLSSNDIGLFQQRIISIDKAMKELHIKIADEPPSSSRKLQYNTELIAMSKQKERLEDRLFELERERRTNRAFEQQSAKTEDIGEEMEVEEGPGLEADDISDADIASACAPSPLTYLKPVAQAEMAGYSMDEILLGLKNSPFLELMDWLTLSYPRIQQEVLDAAEQTPYIPKLTKIEVREAVITYGKDYEISTSNVQPILTLCLKNRKRLIQELKEMFTIEDDGDHFFVAVEVITCDVIEDCLQKADGDVETTKNLLNERVAEKVRQHIWSPVEPDQLVPLDDRLRPVLKTALDVMTSDADKNVKLMIAMAEFKLSYAAADELLYIINEYYQREDRRFEVKDAVIALSEPGIPAYRLHSSALIYLSNKCSVCFDKFPSHEMANLCCHDTSAKDMGCCKECARGQFEVFITGQPVAEFVCPARCGAPDTTDSVGAEEFFETLLNVVFPNIGLSPELIAKFNNKIAIWRLSFERNFYWCPNAKCCEDGYGFVDDRNVLKIACPRCGISIKCRSCEKPWKDEHENKTCDEFATWERENSDEYVEGVQRRDELMTLFGIKCPKCQKQFYLSRGGCMDCICPQCKYQFCNGCGTPLYPKECPKNAQLQCQRLGLHGHHPRNCHSYLRDFSTDQLKRLLQENEVEFNSGANGKNCQEVLEKDNKPWGLKRLLQGAFSNVYSFHPGLFCTQAFLPGIALQAWITRARSSSLLCLSMGAGRNAVYRGPSLRKSSGQTGFHLGHFS